LEVKTKKRRIEMALAELPALHFFATSMSAGGASPAPEPIPVDQLNIPCKHRANQRSRR
jgi:hypothetical protein